MFKSLAAIASLLVATAFLYSGNGLQGTLLAVRGDLEGFSTTTLGVLMSAYFAGFIAGCRLVPGIIKNVGHIRAFLALASVASSSALAHALILEPITWAGLRAVTGFAFAGLAMIMESWINERATNANRGQLLSVYRMVDLGSLTIGNALLGLADPNNFTLFAFVSILMSISLVPVALTSSSAPAPLASAKLDLAKLYRVSPVGAGGALATGLANAAFWGLAPVYVQRAGYDAATIGAFMSICIIGAATFQFPLGWLSDRLDRRKVILGASAIGVAASTGVAIFGQISSTYLFVTGFVFGAFIIPTFGLCAAHAADHADEGEAVATSGGLLMLHGIGAIVGAFAGSAVIALSSASALFYYIAATYAVLCIFTLIRMPLRKAVATDEKVPFAPVPRSPSTQVATDTIGEIGEDDG